MSPLSSSPAESSKTVILFLAADPSELTRLRLAEEAQQIRNLLLQISKYRDNFDVQTLFSVKPADITQAMLDFNPDIVHFSCHGTESGYLVFEDGIGQAKLVSAHALDALFNQFSRKVRCVVLNACYSHTQAEAIGKHIKHVVGTTQAIGDTTIALPFSVGFYQALGAGATIEDAYQMGLVQIKLSNAQMRDPVPMVLIDGRAATETIQETEEKMAKIDHEITKLKTKVDASKQKRLKFLLIGLAGVGKSSTINSLMGKPVAEVSSWTAMTQDVTPYENDSMGVKYAVYDTPGFGDDLDDQHNMKYIDLIKQEVDEIDSVLYVTPLGARRVSGDEKRCIKLVTEQLGRDVWKHAVIVFTQANAPLPEPYADALQHRTELIRSEIGNYVDAQTAEAIPSVAIDNTVRTTPDGKEWLNVFWYTVHQRMTAAGKIAFYFASEDRIANGAIPLTETQKRGVFQNITDWAKENHIAEGAGTLAMAYGVMLAPMLIGAAVAGPAGALVGALISSVAGRLLGGSDDDYPVGL